MSNSLIKATARNITARTNSKSTAVGALSLLLKLFFTSSAVFCLYIISILGSYSEALTLPFGYIPYYALFISGVTFSVCFFIITEYSEKRWFFKNAVGAEKPSFFNNLSIRTQMKIIYIKLLKSVISLIVTVLYLFPSAAVLFTMLYKLRNSGINRMIFIFASALYLFTVLLGLYFSFVTMQKYALTDEIISLNSNLKTTDIIALSKQKTAGVCFRLAKFKLSFTPWFLSCVLVLPLLFVIPYYRQSFSVAAKRLIKYGEAEETEPKPVILMRLAPTD